MDWIKRNLFFVIGAVVALVLMGLAGYYAWSGYSVNAEQNEKLKTIYEESKRLAEKKPHPGDKKTDNIAAAKEQRKEIQELIGKIGQHLRPIPAIPEGGTNVTSREYAEALRATITWLQRDATNNSVFLPVVPGGYAYSFGVQRQLIKFAPGSLEPLSVQLGEVRAICGVLHAAKINALDSVRRARVSADDNSGAATDYLELSSTTNDLAILTPYEVTFRCYTPELADVLEGMAASPYGLVVKSINVEPATTTTLADAAALTPQPYTYAPVFAQTPQVVEGRYDNAAAMRSRYGLGGGRAGEGRGPMAQPQAQPQPVAVAPVARPTTKIILNERQLRVTMMIQVVKLLPRK
ncbi:MAG: hypothetical protein HOP33_00500 [Verrucomicrobia bacterium]|nr:hypothetical protein [Verrucomicrobiota bacterium]